MVGIIRAAFVAVRQTRRARMIAGGLAIAAISACTTGSVLSLEPAVDVGSQTSAVPNYAGPKYAGPKYAGMQSLVPSNPYLTAAYPRMDEPMAPTEQMPASEVDCRNELKRLGVVYTDLAPIREGQCGIDYPVKISAIGSIGMKPAATLTCDMAATFAGWTRNELVPSARWRYFSGVKTIRQGSSYSCRRIAGEGVLSEHGKGNALDVMSIELGNGKEIDVRKPGLFAFRTRGFLNTVRADGCQYFTTVLGPGYNYDHRNHFHFDIKNRRNGYRACR
ncbi:extensin-like domain-containing protein [Mesorhizobium mediterraneum]|uniref:extensin-like domain-containing protein n=1 Tax=Mesorhizobium mediterraneum TaxID=43617 RepID=UPI001782FD65|nr:extensin family protein [Mesorhizobium mediterraneum]